MNKFEKNKPGFTLIETLITIVVLSLVLGAIYGSYVLSQKAYQQGETLGEITQNGRVILERLTREIRQAKKIVTDLPLEEALATSTIMFEDGHDIQPYHYIRYFKEGGFIERETVVFYFSGDIGETPVPWNAQPPVGQTLIAKTLEQAEVIGEYLASLKFFSSTTTQIVLTLEKKNASIKLSSEVLGRNF